MIRRVFYAASGASDLIAFHRSWVAGEIYPKEVAVTFPSQIQDFCKDIGAKAYFVSTKADENKLEDGNFILEHRPKRPKRGLAFHFEELRYGVGLLRTARAFGADVALLDSGVTHYFWMAIFRLFRIPVVVILHNTLWPKGFRPTSRFKRIIQKFDAVFWRRGPVAALAVSPEAERQIRELSPNHTTPVYQIRAQFYPDYFKDIPPPPPVDGTPFQVLFVGRVNREKGVLDIPLMARRIETTHPGLVRWTICGTGPHFEDLKKAVAREAAGAIVDVRGWTSLEELQQIFARSHASIVPTRSLFAEGLAMTAAEAILAGRPVITNPIVPAAELLAPAVMLARSNDPDSHADAVLKLATKPELYERLRRETENLRAPFYDRTQGLRAGLHRALQTFLT